MGTKVMDSTPAPMVTSDHPIWTLAVARAMASRPEAQKRLTVAPDTLLGNPAIRAATRPMFRPCSASGKAQPTMTSSKSSKSRFLVRSTADFMIKVISSSGLVWLNRPLFCLQPGVLTDCTIYASCMV